MQKKKLQTQLSRPPIVVFLGHVDHGKTTLLDFIRQTKVAEKEAGGITQRVGVSQIATKATGPVADSERSLTRREGLRPGGEGKKITFIDTPGHAAFFSMRSRGAKVADIAILVVAADDGVKPQTKEALEHILEAKIPFIVAATKIDLPTAILETVRSQLEKEGVLFEGRGGDVPLLGVSGKSGQGVEELLEMISLVSELHEIKGSPQENLEAVVIETGKDKAGPTATVIVRNGTLSVGEVVVTEKESTKIRGLFDYNGKSVKSISPGEPALVLGFRDVPPVGSSVWSQNDNSFVKFAEKKVINKLQVDEGQIPIVLKAQNAGSLEAVIASLPKEIVVISGAVGDVNESDVFIAKSSSSKIFAFESKIPTSVQKLADTEGVELESFNIVYELLEKVDEMIKKGEVEVLGKAEIIATFPYEAKKIAGSKILQGKISKKDNVVLMSKEKEVGIVKILSMKKGKVDIEEAKQGEECGIFFAPQLDFNVGDVILSVRK